MSCRLKRDPLTYFGVAQPDGIFDILDRLIQQAERARRLGKNVCILLVEEEQHRAPGAAPQSAELAECRQRRVR